MRMEHVKFLLTDYLKGTLDASLRQEVEVHLRECADCCKEANDLKSALDKLQEYRSATPSSHYFATILPRVRQRLEQRPSFHITISPLVTRLAMPLAAAMLAVTLLVRVQIGTNILFPQNGTSISLSSEEISELWLTFLHEDVLSAIPSSAIEEHLLQKVLTEESIIPSYTVSGVPTRELLKGLDEKEVEELLQRLGGKSIL